jgi:hypothetical protein
MFVRVRASFRGVRRPEVRQSSARSETIHPLSVSSPLPTAKKVKADDLENLQECPNSPLARSSYWPMVLTLEGYSRAHKRLQHRNITIGEITLIALVR